MDEPISEQVLADMVEYYRARAEEYDQTYFRQGSYDRGSELNARWFAALEEVFSALDRFHFTGDVLELAGGTGIWTERLARTARSLTVIDASPEMLAINRRRVGRESVRYVVVDIFAWRPDRSYDAVVFAFWLSHVPREHLDAFLRNVRTATRPGGKIFFVDSQPEAERTACDQRRLTDESQIVTRRLDDGREFHIIKNYFQPSELAAHFQAADLPVTIHQTTHYFLCGFGERTAA